MTCSDNLEAYLKEFIKATNRGIIIGLVATALIIILLWVAA